MVCFSTFMKKKKICVNYTPSRGKRLSCIEQMQHAGLMTVKSFSNLTQMRM